jgi:pSer/pThr/pTyr-binding forkhead associated (FHA) protein
VLPNPEVSRRHARIEVADQEWRVFDLHSRNGTWINGKRIDAEAVDVGDEVAFAGLRFAVEPG